MSSPPRRKMKLSPLTPIKADVVEITPEEIEDGPTTRLVKTEVQSSKTSDRNIKNSVEDKDEEGAYEIEYVEEENSDDEIDAAELRYYSYPSAQIMGFYVQESKAKNFDKLQIEKSLIKLQQNDMEFKEKICADRPVNDLFQRVVNEDNHGMSNAEFDNAYSADFDTMVGKTITEGIKMRLLFAIKQRRLVAQYYDDMCNKEFIWTAITRELSEISNIACQWKEKSIQSIIQYIFAEQRMDQSQVTMLSPTGRTLEELLDQLKEGDVFMKEIIRINHKLTTEQEYTS